MSNEAMQPATVRVRPQEAHFRAENRLWQGIPGIELTKNGTMYVILYSGKKGEGSGNFRRGEDEVTTTTAGFLSDYSGFAFNLNEKTHNLFHAPTAISVNGEVEHAGSHTVLSTPLGFGDNATNDFAVDFSGDFSL